jgi:hypothetical protein
MKNDSVIGIDSEFDESLFHALIQTSCCQFDLEESDDTRENPGSLLRKVNSRFPDPGRYRCCLKIASWIEPITSNSLLRAQSSCRVLYPEFSGEEYLLAAVSG